VRLALLLGLLLASTSQAVGLAADGTLIGFIPNRPKPPCFGESCYIPCQQAYDEADNQSAVSNACLQHCMLNNGGGGASGGHPAAFMEACMSCASMDITAAVELGVYANCAAAQTLGLGGQFVDTLIDVTGCGEEPETCDTTAAGAGSSMQAVADALGQVLGEPVEFLVDQAAKERVRKTRPMGKPRAQPKK